MFNKDSFIKLKQLFSGVRKRSALALFLMLFQGLTEGVSLLLIIPLLSIAGVANLAQSNNKLSEFISSIFQSSGVELTVVNVLAVYVLIMSFYALLKYFQALNTAEINQKVVVYWRNLFFERLTSSTWASIQSLKSSDFQNTLTIEIRKFGSISNQLVQLCGGGILIAVYLTISALLSFQLTLIAFIPIAIIAFLNQPINRKTYALGKASVGFNREMQSIILENLSALKLVKSYQKEKDQLEDFQLVSDEIEQKVISFQKASQQSKTLFEIIAAVIIAFYIYLAISVYQLAVTELLLLIFIFARLLPKASRVVSSFQQILNQLPALESTHETMNQLKAERFQSTPARTEFQLTENILFKKVHFSYGSKKVLENLNFQIIANKTNVITGASGAGKSTTIDLIMGLLLPNSGAVLIDSVDLNEIDPLAWKASIAYVPQDAFLFHDSIRSNLKWANNSAEEFQIWEALAQAGAEEFVEKLPNGLDTIVGDRGTKISGGERQRIALARALIRKPQLLILDEATSAVDDENEELIKSALAKLQGKMTIIIVAHRSKLIELADNIIDLK